MRGSLNTSAETPDTTVSAGETGEIVCFCLHYLLKPDEIFIQTAETKFRQRPPQFSK